MILRLTLALTLAVLLTACGSSGQPVNGGEDNGALTIVMNVSGTQLELLPGGQKFSARVIDPVENLDNSSLPVNTTISGNTISISQVPKSQVLVVKVSYQPAVALTGSVRSAVVPKTALSTSLAFEIPASTSQLLIDAALTFSPNAAHGYQLSLGTSTHADGSPEVQSHALLDLEDRHLRRDTDGDGGFTNELAFMDSNLDCLSDALEAQVADSHRQPDDGDALLISATIASLDLSAGQVNLSNVESLDGAQGVPASITVHFAENMRLGGFGPMPELAAGDEVQLFVYPLDNASDSGEYWAEALYPMDDQYPIGVLSVTHQPNEANLISWQARTGLTGLLLCRRSSEADLRRPGGKFDFCSPNQSDDWSHELDGDASQYLDEGVAEGRRYSYELYGVLSDGSMVFLGRSADDHQPPPGGDHDGDHGGDGDGDGGKGGDGGHGGHH